MKKKPKKPAKSKAEARRLRIWQNYFSLLGLPGISERQIRELLGRDYG